MLLTSKIKSGINNSDSIPEWVEMINDLKIGAGYSYTKIAYCVGMSPSEVHRIGKGKSHQPKYLAGKALMKLYYKVFYGQKCLAAAANYLRLKKSHHLGWLKNISASFEETSESSH